PDAAVVEARVHVFEQLTLTQAARLEGRRALYRLWLDGLRRKKGDRWLYTADGPGEEVVVLTLPAGVSDGEYSVEAELHLYYVPEPGGEGEWHYRLEEAV